MAFVPICKPQRHRGHRVELICLAFTVSSVPRFNRVRSNVPSALRELRAGHERLAQCAPRRAARLFLAVFGNERLGALYLFLGWVPREAKLIGPREPRRLV